jgi:hypothetical protein
VEERPRGGSGNQGWREGVWLVWWNEYVIMLLNVCFSSLMRQLTEHVVADAAVGALDLGRVCLVDVVGLVEPRPALGALDVGAVRAMVRVEAAAHTEER